MHEIIDVSEYAPTILRELRRGVLLTASADGEVNPMTIGWGTVGIEWGKPIFVAYVRRGRHTHDLLEKNPEFTISVPMRSGDLDYDRRVRSIVATCGTRSGRDIDKVSELDLTLVDGEKISVPAIKELPLTLECRVLYQREQDVSLLPDDIRASNYPADVPSTNSGSNADPHTAYYGEIVSSYLLK